MFAVGTKNVIAYTNVIKNVSKIICIQDREKN